MNEKTNRTSVAVIGSGGTIAGLAASRSDFQSYRGGALTTAELLDSLADELDGVARTEPIDFRGEGGGCRTLRDFHALSTLVDTHLAADADAAVVLCGTRQLEEVAYWLDLTVRSPKPVVVTGSFRPWNALGSDGQANLHNAVALAASGRTTGFGTVVALNDRVLSARDAAKSDTLRLDAFRGREWGALGVVDERNIRLLRAPARVLLHGRPEWGTPFDLTRIDPDRLPRTEIAYSYTDAGGEAVAAFARSGVAGVVMAGDPSDRQAGALREAVGAGLVVVAAGRNTTGAVYDPGVPGIIAAEDLTPQKARLLLTLGLAVTDDVDRLRSLFREHGVPEFG
ncbi:asparaginase domain-containing protein [Saccharothrix yanglingensis]|uniref:L-asparaginase n=1 Tax=Saccharothrix yanglingensis TaxID=659496 RepID=A0ABU0WZ63_9PSEU|nr:asparaginase domain-containing protein [Saccharothrix yanglingensis]MDQ2585161.1 L-asparaginase [Saccharothrix yanglingensis]